MTTQTDYKRIALRQAAQPLTRKEQGFTLVELAIVLVIIGLIIGGVLVGQDLIKAAEIRATIGQTEKYNAAVNTFRDKFQAIPGDMILSRAQQFAIAPTTAGDRQGTDGAGDGDGLVENGGTAANKQGLGFETRAFWSDLTQADLIPQGVTLLVSGTPLAATAYANSAALLTANVLPVSKLRQSTYIHTYALNGRNYFYLGGISAVAGTGILTLSAGVSPLEGSAIDEKIDDGKTNSGQVIAVLNITANLVDDGSAGTAAFSEATDCLSAANAYNAGKTFGGNMNCMMVIRSGF